MIKFEYKEKSEWLKHAPLINSWAPFNKKNTNFVPLLTKQGIIDIFRNSDQEVEESVKKVMKGK